MPRRARIVLPGVPLHMIQRGNNRSACFFAHEDYSYYLENLTELAAKHNCAVHAYCLMTNHVHILLTPDDSLAPSRRKKGDRPRFSPKKGDRLQRQNKLTHPMLR